MKLSVIIPVYNEEKTISKIINLVKKQEIAGFKKEIIVVDDGSNDGTYDALMKFKGIKTLKHETNKGKGRAIRTGLEKVTGEIVIIQDADLELSPSDYPELIKPFIESNAKVVYGSRNLIHRGKGTILSYYFGGKIVTAIANLIYGIKITDEPIGYKLFKTELLRDLNLECERFEFFPEVTAKIAKRKIKIYEVPVKYYPRKLKDGKKLRFSDGIDAVKTLIKYKFKK